MKRFYLSLFGVIVILLYAGCILFQRWGDRTATAYDIENGPLYWECISTSNLVHGHYQVMDFAPNGLLYLGYHPHNGFHIYQYDGTFWTLTGTFDFFVPRNADFAFTSDSTPYLAVNNTHIIKYDGNDWIGLSVNVLSDALSKHGFNWNSTKIEFDSQDRLYILCLKPTVDYYTEKEGIWPHLYIMTNNQVYSVDEYLTDREVEGLQLRMNTEDHPVIFYVISNQIYVTEYIGTDKTTITYSTDGIYIRDWAFTLTPQNEPLVFFSKGFNDPHIIKYDGNQWVELGTDHVFQFYAHENYFIDCDDNGEIYIGYECCYAGVRVLKLVGNGFVYLGTRDFSHGDRNNRPCFALSPDGIPYTAYEGYLFSMEVMRFRSDWVHEDLYCPYTNKNVEDMY